MSRRLMLRSNAAEHAFEPFPVSPWTLRMQVNGTGAQQSGSATYKYTALCQTFYPVSTGDKFIRTSPSVDGDGVSVTNWIHEYRTDSAYASAWIKRTYLVTGQEYTVGEGCNYVRFGCAYPSSTGKTMTQDIINECFAVSKKER